MVTTAAAATVAGEVYDLRSGTLVAGAVVKVGGEETTAGADGAYKVIAVAPARVTLVARADGYAVTAKRGLRVSSAGNGTWFNVPLMPLATSGPYDGDFYDMFFARAPLEEVFPGLVVARRYEGLPLGIYVADGTPEEIDFVADVVEALNEKWGTGIFQLAAPDKADVVVSFGDGAGVTGPYYREAVAKGSFPGGVSEENEALLAAYLRRLVLAGPGRWGAVAAEELRADVPLGEDLDAIIAIIYRERADFNYAIFTRREPARLALLIDLYLGIGGYGRSGVTDAAGADVVFPSEYQQGQVNVAGGVGWRGVWAKVGWWFAGIWNPDAERAYSPEDPPEKVIRRNSSIYYRGGYRWLAAAPLEVTPFVGYRKLSVRGKFLGTVAERTHVVRVDLDFRNDYGGPEAGAGLSAALPWFGIGLFGEYARVFGREQYNLAEFGVGAVNRVGVGTFAFGRFYWGRRFDYAFAGLAMRLSLPL